MKHVLTTLLFTLIVGFGLVGQYQFSTSVEVQGNKTVVIELETTGIEILNSGNPPYDCKWGYNYNVLFDYSIKAYNQNNKEVGFNQIYTLQGSFVCNDKTTFFNLPNKMGEGSGKTVGNIWVGESTCNTATVESLLCDQVEFQIQMKGYNGDQFITVGNTSTLPIELMTFDAYKNDREVEVNWKTASELNNDYFTIERSKDGFSWENIQTVPGAGNSSRTIAYSWIDHSPYAGISYYRLSQTDFDGTTEVFNIVSIENEAEEELQAYPNPVLHSATLIGVDESLGLRIFNAVGVEVTGNVNSTSSPSGKTFVDMSQLPQGMYYVVNGEESLRLIKK
ncbi:T9SS type A sorting domain-containing protein [Brumimicrobium oceani]|uniref:Secretion system C-terminal sorting domain-containing protein n=1 Tax=Brumimicrobium oceani TaxID=2100725 RepID=A0A2U2X0A9_9FLAO|nr:T9SS type A sorting domain-containing protein [Brumimicrobium oceani]PWH81209.1 hypothetical protein DIT68_16080 [Brumimicrobium oceani]